MTQTINDLELIEHLDFDPPCEHSEHESSKEHEGEAFALVQFKCSHCDHTVRLSLCERFYRVATEGYMRLRCGHCNVRTLGKIGYTIITLY